MAPVVEIERVARERVVVRETAETSQQAETGVVVARAAAEANFAVTVEWSLRGRR